MNQSISRSACIAAVLAACSAQQGPELTPAPTANTATETGKGAVATVAGVRIEVQAGAWKWEPNDLQGKVTPLLLQIENTGASAVLVRYNRISLTTPSGKHYAAMPPYDVNVKLTEAYTVRNPYYPVTGFTVAPYLRYHYPLLRPYDGAFGYDATYYDPYLTAYRRIQLPSADMIQRALPEGVLAPGGKLSGFIYFERVDENAPRFEFTFDLTDAGSNSPLGTASIPFVNKR